MAMETGGSAGTCGVGANYLAVCDAARGAGAEDAVRAARGVRSVLSRARDLFTFEYDSPSPGEPRTSLMLVAPVAGNSGAAVVAHLDVSERRAAQVVLQESEERFRGIFHRAPIGILRLDLGGRIIDANPAVGAIAGRTPAALRGRHISTLWHPLDSEVAARELAQLLTSGRSEQGRARRYIRADGCSVPVSEAAAVVVDPRGRPQAIVFTVEDVSGRSVAAPAPRPVGATTEAALRQPATTG
jgi:PAS domain S-box-containing protein